MLFIYFKEKSLFVYKHINNTCCNGMTNKTYDRQESSLEQINSNFSSILQFISQAQKYKQIHYLIIYGT